MQGGARGFRLRMQISERFGRNKSAKVNCISWRIDLGVAGPEMRLENHVQKKRKAQDEAVMADDQLPLLYTAHDFQSFLSVSGQESPKRSVTLVLSWFSFLSVFLLISSSNRCILVVCSLQVLTFPPKQVESRTFSIIHFSCHLVDWQLFW